MLTNLTEEGKICGLTFSNMVNRIGKRTTTSRNILKQTIIRSIKSTLFFAA